MQVVFPSPPMMDLGMSYAASPSRLLSASFMSSPHSWSDFAISLKTLISDMTGGHALGRLGASLLIYEGFSSEDSVLHASSNIRIF